MKKRRIETYIYRDKILKEISAKIKLLGPDYKYNAITIMNVRVLSSIIIFFMILHLIDFGYILAPILTFMYYEFFLKLYFDSKLQKRRNKLDKEAMYFFEILTLSLESGNNLTNALRITSNSIDSELSLEFREVLRQVSLGKSLDESLEDLKYSIPSDAINNIVLNIRESHLFGNNILDTLYNQVSYIRDRIILESRAYISKIPLKISVVSVVFFIPLLLLLILGPIIIEFLS